MTRQQTFHSTRHPHQWHSQTKLLGKQKLGWVKIFVFGRKTVFCLGHRPSKH